MVTASRRSRQALTILVVGLSAAGPGRAVAQQERNRDDPFARLEYFNRQRAYPFRRIPPHALQAARGAFAQRWPAAVRAQGSPVTSAVVGWVGFGPSPILSFGARYAGRVTSIAIDPNNSNHMYVAAAEGGVWRSFEGGANWTPLGDPNRASNSYILCSPLARDCRRQGIQGGDRQVGQRNHRPESTHGAVHSGSSLPVFL